MTEEYVEIETKLRVDEDELSVIERTLENIGGEKVADQSGVRSINVFFDTPTGKLEQADELLRVRELLDTNTGEATLSCITFKGPRAESGEGFKEREEIEFGITLGKADTAIQFFRALGYKICERLEYIIHATWMWEGVEVTLKEIPFLGFFIELEGPKQQINDLIGKLGLDPDEKIKLRYEDLWHQQFADRENVNWSQFTFEHEAEVLS